MKNQFQINLNRGSKNGDLHSVFNTSSSTFLYTKKSNLENRILKLLTEDSHLII